MWNITWVTCTYTHLWTVLLPGAPPRSVITGQEVEAWPLTGGDGSSPEELWPYNQVIQLLYSRRKTTAHSPPSQQNRTSWGLLILEAGRASFHQPVFDLSRQPDRFQSHSCCSASRCTHTTMKTTDLSKSCHQNLLTLKHIISEPSATLRVLFRAERSSRTRWMTDINHLSEQQEAVRPANTNRTSQKHDISSSYESNEIQQFAESWSRTLVAFGLILSWCSRLQPTSSVERLLSHVLNTTLFKCIASYMYVCWLFYCRIFILLKIFKLLKHNKNKMTLKQCLTELIFKWKLFMVFFMSHLVQYSQCVLWFYSGLMLTDVEIPFWKVVSGLAAVRICPKSFLATKKKNGKCPNILSKYSVVSLSQVVKRCLERWCLARQLSSLDFVPKSCQKKSRFVATKTARKSRHL